MIDAFNSSWDSDKINENQWEETAQGIDEYIETSHWTLIEVKDFDISDDIAFLDGIPSVVKVFLVLTCVVYNRCSLKSLYFIQKLQVLRIYKIFSVRFNKPKHQLIAQA